MRWTEHEVNFGTRWESSHPCFQGAITETAGDAGYHCYLDNRYVGHSFTLDGAKEIVKNALIAKVRAIEEHLGDEARTKEHRLWKAVVSRGVSTQQTRKKGLCLLLRTAEFEPWENDKGIKALTQYAEGITPVSVLPE